MALRGLLGRPGLDVAGPAAAAVVVGPAAAVAGGVGVVCQESVAQKCVGCFCGHAIFERLRFARTRSRRLLVAVGLAVLV